MKKGLTLLKLLFIIGIVISILLKVVLIMDPFERLAKNRDARRIADLETLKNAIVLYYEKYPEGFLGEGNQTHSHIKGIQCNTEIESNNISQSIDGSGWIPIDFTKLGDAFPFRSLPIDPVNKEDLNLYYVYTVDPHKGTFKLTANMESKYYSKGGAGDVTSTDGGRVDSLYETGTDLSLEPTHLSVNCFLFISTTPNTSKSTITTTNINTPTTTTTANTITTIEPMTTTTNTLSPWFCGDNVVFTYRGSTVSYETVMSNGKCWMKRNLGASRVAQSSTDSEAYGDYFQWGRGDDGHQNKNSELTNILSRSDNPGHGDFITIADDPHDWRNPQNDNLWQGINGINNPCPPGWRIPTTKEWDNEMYSWSNKNYHGAYDSPLKLTLGGFRNYGDGWLINVGNYAYYWSSTINGVYAKGFYFYSNDAHYFYAGRAYGYLVRCIKD